MKSHFKTQDEVLTKLEQAGVSKGELHLKPQKYEHIFELS